MKTMILLSIIINIITMLLLFVCLILPKSFPQKQKSMCGVVLTIGLLLYFIIFSITSLLGIIFGRYELTGLIFFIIIPFVIGHYSRYEKFKKYTLIQLLAFTGSLVLLTAEFMTHF